jgi:hypothetical protein
MEQAAQLELMILKVLSVEELMSLAAEGFARARDVLVSIFRGLPGS